MKFSITRASNTDRTLSPCKGAELELEVITSKINGNRYIHHRWSINIDSLEDLMHFIRENGEITIDEDSICIYDDYIE